MNIKVDRTVNLQGELVFTITVPVPSHVPCFQSDETSIMNMLEICKSNIEKHTSAESKTHQDVINLIHLAKEKTFFRVLNSLKFSIKNHLQPKFEPICQEIYNWIYDHQKDEVKKWLSEIDPQRTKYYFDNDPQAAKQEPQESEHDDDDFDDDDV